MESGSSKSNLLKLCEMKAKQELNPVSLSPETYTALRYETAKNTEIYTLKKIRHMVCLSRRIAPYKNTL